MIEIIVNGQNYDGFLDFSVQKSFLDLSAAFSLNAVNSENLSFPLKVNDSIEIKFSDQSIIKGFIEKIAPNYDASTHVISLSGRDLLGDLIDSSISGEFQNTVFNTPISLIQIAQELLKNFGYENISVTSNVTLEDFTKGELKAMEIAGGAFEFLERLAHLKQVIMTNDGIGNIIFDRPSQERLPIVVLNEFNNNDNNIISGDLNIDYTRRFHTYQVISQGNPADQTQVNESQATLVNRNGTSIDNEIRPTRQMIISASESLTPAQATSQAVWENNIRRAESKVYRCQVPGFFINEEKSNIWRPNLLVQVKDDFAKINSPMLINAVNYSNSLSGTFVNLELLAPDAFTLEATQTPNQTASNDLSQEFIGSS